MTCYNPNVFINELTNHKNPSENSKGTPETDERLIIITYDQLGFIGSKEIDEGTGSR